MSSDGDGKVTAAEVTNNFCDEFLSVIVGLAAAAPILDELRCKDREIMSLKAKIAALGGDPNEVMPNEAPEVVISQAEVDDLIKFLKRGPGNGAPGSDTRAAASKMTYVCTKVIAKLAFKLVQDPITDTHDLESFFKVVKSVIADSIQYFATTLAPLIKVMPKGKGIATILDMLRHKIKGGDFDKELRGLSGCLFKVLDQDDDGTISPGDFKVYTDLIFEPCLDDESAKAKFMALYNNLDSNKNGTLSQDEITSFLSKIINLAGNGVIFVLTLAEIAFSMQADKEIKAMMDFYVEDCKEQKFREVSLKTLSPAAPMIISSTRQTRYNAALLRHINMHLRRMKSAQQALTRVCLLLSDRGVRYCRVQLPGDGHPVGGALRQETLGFLGSDERFLIFSRQVLVYSNAWSRWTWAQARPTNPGPAGRLGQSRRLTCFTVYVYSAENGGVPKARSACLS